MSHTLALQTGFHSPLEVKADIDERLSNYFSTRGQAAGELDPSYADLWAAIQTLAMAGGKRLRPYMVVLAYECYGGTDYQGVLDVALAHELLHLSLLIHDDIADKDYVRHGVLNVAGQYRRKYAEHQSSDTAAHFANAAALMAGDLLLSAAHTQVFASHFATDDKVAVLELFSQLTFEVAAGQHLDMEAVLQPIAETKPLRIVRYKTAGYSFKGPLVCGAMLAHAPASDSAHLEQLGHSLGAAFQLSDDLLGVFGNEKLTGKSSSNDLREAKRTLLAQITDQRLTGDDYEAFGRLFGKPDLNDEEASELRALMVGCGAKAEVEARIEQYRNEAVTALDGLSISEQARAQLEQLVSRVTDRQS